MERLTYVTEDGKILFHPEDLPEDEGMTVKELAENRRWKTLDQIAEKLTNMEQMEEQGLLVRLPCKVGTEVFCFFPGDSHYTKCQIKKIEIRPSIFGNICYFAEPVGQRGRCCRYFDYEFGKFLFLTREEAEKKLEEMKK